MSLLCKHSNYKQLIEQSKQPSPTNMSVHGFAQDNAGIYTYIQKRCIKGISLFISRRGRCAGGMTVEAAVILPLLIFFLLNLGSIVDMLRLHGNVELAITNAGNSLSVYGYMRETEAGTEEAKEGVLQDAAELLSSYFFTKEDVKRYLGEEYLEAAPLVDGNDGLICHLWELSEEDYVNIVYSYRVGCPFPVPGFGEHRMTNRYYSHIWTGYEIPGAAQGEGLETVFLTANGSVYHLSLECSHLSLSVEEVNMRQLTERRNEEGDAYVLCRLCNNEPYGGVVYITASGACYHYSRECTGLKRTIYSVTLAEAKQNGLEVCSRCERNKDYD